MLWHVSWSIAVAMPRPGPLLCSVIFAVLFTLSTVRCCCRLEFGDCWFCALLADGGALITLSSPLFAC